jgi:chaperonin GroES
VAEVALLAEEETERPDKRDEPLTFGDIFAPGVNLADFLPDSELTRIGQLVIRDVDIDEKSREDWCKRYDRWLDVAMQTREAKNTPWANASNVKYPLLTVASIQFQARAYPAIIDSSNLVKGRVLGPDPDGTKRARADRIGQHMTWQLLYRMPGWEEDTDKLLLMLPITGTVIRKTFYDSIENANRSEMIPAKDFVINYMAKSLETAPRYTHVLHHYPYEVQEKVAAGLWRDIRVEADSDAANDDEDAIVDFYEQHRTLDLDKDGYPEHYVVTTNKEGQVARIVPCFGPEDVTVMSPALAKNVKLSEIVEEGAEFPEGLKIVRIGRRQYFTKYGFLPAPDGSFYDVGFGALLDDITQSIDTSINQMLDAGALQNAGGGFLGDGVKILGGEKGFRLGEWKRISSPGGLLKDNIVPLPAGGPSAVLFNLLGMLIEGAKDITAVQDVMVGEGTANQPATTTLALIEQGQKVMSGIFKRIHRAFGCELRILRRLNRDYLDEEEYFQLNDAEDAGQISREDYADEDLDVIPVSDPNAVSDMQKMARAQALMMFNGDPLVNQLEIRRRVLEAIGERDTKVLLEVPPPAPDPKVVEMGAKLDIAEKDAETRQIAAKGSAAKSVSDAAIALASVGLLSDAAALAQAGTDLGLEAATGDENANPQPGGVPAMEGPSADAGVPELPGGAPGGLDPGMGLGSIDDGSGASAGGPVGPAGSDQL